MHWGIPFCYEYAFRSPHTPCVADGTRSVPATIQVISARSLARPGGQFPRHRQLEIEDPIEVLRAAGLLGVSRKTLFNKMTALQIRWSGRPENETS